METATAVLGVILKYLWMPFSGFVMWLWSERKKDAKETAAKFETIEGRLLVVENRYMTEEKTKLLMKEMIGDLKADMAKMNETLVHISSLVIDLRQDLAVNKAVQEALERKNTKPYHE